jgi:D-alanyl-D-alanine carboxypeptidase
MSTQSIVLLALLPIASLLLLSGCPVPPPAAGDDDAVQEIDPALDAALQAALGGMVDESPAAGLTAAIEFADGAVWTGAAGSTHPDELDGSRPMVADDLFNIASITKSFTAGLVLTLVDEGLLALDDSFEAWVPGGHARGAEISLRQLLKHTAGVPEHTMTPEFQANYSASWTDEELLALVASLDLVNEPGAAAAYSNSHFVMLSLVVAAATGMPWREALAERVLVPLGLEDSTVPGVGDDWGGVVPTWLGGSPFPSILHPTGPGAAGCMVSDADDVARWTRARFGGSFLSPELTAVQVEDLEPLGGPFFLGLGALIVDSTGDALEWGHNGALNGYAGWSGYRPDIDASITLLGNAWGAGNPPEFSYPLGLHLDLWAEVDAHLAAAR